MENVSFRISEELKDKIMDFYQEYKIDNNGEYIIFFAKYEKITITIFESKKGYKVLFSGEGSLSEAKIFNEDAEITIKEKKEISFETFEPQIGSDEVGFGDFFGPLIVVAAYFDGNQSKLDKIKDSKKLTDQFILEFVPTILKDTIFSKLTVHNDKYNQLINKGYNMNQIKAVLHNYCLVNLHKKMPYVQNVYVDKFCDEKLYYQYLSQSKEVEKHIVFKEKGETYFPSVALASCIARYLFLKEIATLNEKYKVKIPLGASAEVDKFAIEFIKKYGENEFLKICKSNFKNYQKIKEQEQEKLF